MKYNVLQRIESEEVLAPAVSVIITVYNGAEYLAECLESIFAQTLKNIEIICVDDASTDNTPQLLKTYRDRITIITNPSNRMAGESRNIGFEKTTGEYVIFLDADDVFESDMLEKAYEKAKSCEADICIFREDLFSESIENRTGYSYAEPFMKELETRDFFSPKELADMLFSLWNGWAWDKLFRREFIAGTGLKFQKLQSTNDGFFVHAALALSERISLVNKVLVHHRTGNGSSLSNTRDKAWESCLVYLKELRRDLMQRGVFVTFERSYLNWSLEFLYWNYQTLNEASKKKLAEAIRQFFINEIEIMRYGREDFYNEFSGWFADCIMKNEENKIPVTEAERFRKTYQLNELKIEALQKYLTKHRWKTALWGAGIRGRAFAEIYGESWNNIQCVYDTDRTKQGQAICNELMIREFSVQNAEKTDCILVLNSAHIASVLEKLHGKQVVVFDLNTYLNSPRELEDCILKGD